VKYLCGTTHYIAMSTPKIIETKLSATGQLKPFTSIMWKEPPLTEWKEIAEGSRQTFRIKHGPHIK
jgi:hypothetical protein